MSVNPGSLAGQAPQYPATFQSRQTRDAQRALTEQAAAKTGQAMQIGAGGILVNDGGSITIQGTGAFNTNGAINTTGSISASTTVTAGTTITAGANITSTGGSVSAINVTASSAVTGGTVGASGDITASGRVVSAGIINSPGTKSNTVTVGYSAVYIDSSGNMGGNTSSRRFKTNIGPAGYDLDAFLALPAYSYQRTSDILELGVDAAPWFDGMMAEDVAPILPLHVWYDENGLVEGVRFEELVTPLIQAVARERHQRLMMQAYYGSRLAALEKAAGIVPPAPPGASA